MTVTPAVVAPPRPATMRPHRSAEATTAVLAGSAAFLAAALGFVLQPLVARLVLPALGGSPAVWGIALVFFQATLLVGYLLAHLVATRVPARWQAVAFGAMALLAAATLPVALPPGWSPSAGSSPALSLLAVLAVTAGPLFCVTSAASPLLGHWFGSSGAAGSRNPYVLYAASNAGSLLGLLAYPLLIEPSLPLSAQGRWWAAGYAAFALAAAVLGWRVRGAAPADRPPARHPPRWRRRMVWMALAAAPSALVIGTTAFLTTDLAAVPLLWVVPLALYLLSFVLAFAPRRAEGAPPLGLRSGSAVLPFLAVAAVLGFVGVLSVPLPGLVALHLALLLAAACTAHGRLAAIRPEPGQLTTFYLCIAVGGAAGGALASLVAPLVFDRALEYPLAVALVLLARPRRRKAPPLPVSLALGVAVAAGLIWLAPRLADGAAMPLIHATAGIALLGVVWLVAGRPVVLAGVLAVALAWTFVGVPPVLLRERTFFGVHEVYADAGHHVLAHGTTIHGYQSLDADRAGLPLSYFHPDGPLGDVITATGGDDEAVAVVGLGTGAIAAYGRAGQTITFYEIDPVVAAIASDTRWFTFVENSAAEVDVVLGDGRLRLAEVADQAYDLIVLDAFSSDAIPVHLLTAEALAVYVEKLAPGGVIALHVTNRHLDLAPVVGAAAASLGMHGLERDDTAGAVPEEGKEGSHWVALARSPEALDALRGVKEWRPLAQSAMDPWTDDHADLWSALRR